MITHHSVLLYDKNDNLSLFQDTYVYQYLPTEDSGIEVNVESEELETASLESSSPPLQSPISSSPPSSSTLRRRVSPHSVSSSV